MGGLTRRELIEAMGGALAAAAAAPVVTACAVKTGVGVAATAGSSGTGLTVMAGAEVPKRRASGEESTAPAAGDPLRDRDATALAELVRRREVTPLELVDAAIARIEALNPKLNAVIFRTYERARERARGELPDGPFRGVPFLLKGLLPVEGIPIDFGSAFFRGNVAKVTYEVARRMEAAGLVIVGSCNTPEFGLLPTTEPALHGPTHNPWNPAHSPGGSSGGAAAAVASGMLPMAQASDGGGSIRIPASCCGLFGLKPSRGRNPQWPEPDLHGLSERLAVSRTVRDSARLLDAIRGPVSGDRWWAPSPERPYAEEVRRDPGRLRIGFVRTQLGGEPLHPDCVAAVERTAKLCESLGHHVEEAPPEIDRDAFNDAFLLLWASFAGEVIRGATRQLGKPPPREGFEWFTWQLAREDAKHTPGDANLAWGVLHRAGYAMARYLERYDALLTPTLGEPPVRLGELMEPRPYEAMRARLMRYVPFTPVANALGLPAMNVPLFWNAGGLPVGSHFVGRAFDEATLFRLAGQLEQAQPWAGRRPQVFAG